LTQPTPNPEQESPDAPAPPGKALRVVRLSIALVLIAACVVFSVITIRDIGEALAQGRASAATIDEPAYPDRLPGDLALNLDNQFIALGQPGQGSYLDHPPGEIPPFAGAAPYEQHPRRGPIGADGIVTEHGHYVVPGRTPREAFDHYDEHARKRGMKRVTEPDNLDDPRAKLLARWAGEETSFQLTVVPDLDRAQNVRPPRRAEPALSIVVQYSYPAPTK